MPSGQPGFCHTCVIRWDGVEITELLWDDQNVAHIARHDVTVSEVEEVVFGGSALFFDLDQPARPGRIGAFGVTTAGGASPCSSTLRPPRARAAS